MDRLDMLRTFIAVADKESFAEAARALNVSPTTATRGVNGLEAILGVPLLQRSTRSVRLTDEGAVCIKRCRVALADLEEAAEEARGGSSEPHGTIVVTAPVMFGRLHILPVVSILLAMHPGLNVKLMLVDRVVRLLEEGIDVAVRIADLADMSLHAVRVAEVRKVLSASPDYLARHPAPERATDLHDHHLICLDAMSGPHHEWRFGNQGKPSIRINPRLSVNQADAAIAAARSGLGITRTLSYQVADDVMKGDLRLLLEDIEPPPVPVPVNLIFAGNRRSSPNIRAFIDASKAYFLKAAIIKKN